MIRALEILKEMIQVPNAPFSPLGRINYLKSFFEAIGITYEETNYALIVKKGNLQATNKIVVMSHVDHPGFILKNSEEGIYFGSIYYDKLRVKYRDKPLPLNVYDKEGKFLTKASLINLVKTPRRKITIKSNQPIPINSQALWDVEKFSISEEKVSCISHDNDLPTAVMLALLEEDKFSSDHQVVFVFTLYEEVAQNSSFALAKENSLHLNDSDIIINLESMKAYNLEKGYPSAPRVNYKSGMVLNISEKDCLYGYYYKDQRNLAEDLVNNIADKLKLKIQTGIAGGSSDARPFSELKITPNIVTLNVPNRNKHNVTRKGELVSELTSQSDVDSMYRVLSGIVKIQLDSPDTKPNKKSIALKAKQYAAAQNVTAMKAKTVLNERLHTAYKAITKRRYYYPETIIDYILDQCFKIFSYLVYILKR